LTLKYIILYGNANIFKIHIRVHKVIRLGVKGLIRDCIMAFVAFELLTKGMNNFELAMILIATVIFFTILGFLKFFGVLGG